MPALERRGRRGVRGPYQSRLRRAPPRPNARPRTSLCGVYTRDFRENELTCQILVTVPQCSSYRHPRRAETVASLRLPAAAGEDEADRVVSLLPQAPARAMPRRLPRSDLVR
eukprot:392981-Hanusia_phi.AAC.1